MPTLLLLYGFRFFFYSNEGNEPAHVHVVKGSGHGKIWLRPQTAIAYMVGFSGAEERQIMEVLHVYEEDFKQKWDEYFG